MFQCILGEEVIKSIDLTNPTNKAVSYWVKYEGHPDFSLESDDNFKIEPKGTVKFKIKFTSRVSQPVSGRLIFTNKKESNVQAAALVFDLKSNITGRVSEKLWTVQSSLYEVFEFPISVTNKFLIGDSGEFTITITHFKQKNNEEKKAKTKTGKNP